jgi:hypothetical protein
VIEPADEQAVDADGKPSESVSLAVEICSHRTASAIAIFIGGASRSSSLQEPQIERSEHEDNPDVYHQALPEPMSEEQDVHADHDGYQREHAKHHACLPSHCSTLLLEDRVAAAQTLVYCRESDLWNWRLQPIS